MRAARIRLIRARLPPILLDVAHPKAHNGNHAQRLGPCKDVRTNRSAGLPHSSPIDAAERLPLPCPTEGKEHPLAESNQR